METDNFLTLPKHLEGQTNTHGDFEEFWWLDNSPAGSNSSDHSSTRSWHKHLTSNLVFRGQHYWHECNLCKSNMLGWIQFWSFQPIIHPQQIQVYRYTKTFQLPHTKLNSLINCSIIKTSLFSDWIRDAFWQMFEGTTDSNALLHSQVSGQTFLVSLHQTYMLATSIQLRCICAPNDTHWELETHSLIQYPLQ